MNLKYLFLLATSCLGRLSIEEKQQLKLYSHEADEDIYFLEFDKVKEALPAQKTFLLFLGANWCHNTQRFTPKYLKVQKMVEEEKLYQQGFRMAKIECSTDREKFCMEQFKIQGFPTLLAFVDGKLVHEYPYADEVDPLYNYIKKFIADNPPDRSKLYPDWSQTGKLNLQQDFKDLGSNQEQSLFIVVLGVAGLSAAALLIHRWMVKSQYSKVSSHFTD